MSEAAGGGEGGAERRRRPRRRPASAHGREAAGRAEVGLTAWLAALDVGRIVDEAVGLVERVGLAIPGTPSEAGGRRVQFPPARAADLLARAPRQVVHLGATPRDDVGLGADLPVLGLPLSARWLWSGHGERGPLTRRAVVDAARVLDAVPEPRWSAGGLLLGSGPADAERLADLALLDDRPLIAPVSALSAPRLIAAARHRVPRPAGPGHCRLLGVIDLDEALTLTPAAVAAIDRLAEAGEAVVAAPVLLLGANVPLSAEAALVRFAAEVIAVAAMVQSVAPGAPVVAAATVAEVSMRTGLPVTGTAEVMRVWRAIPRVAQRLGLPVVALGPATAGKGLDGQSAAETAAWLAAVADFDGIVGALGALELDRGLGLEKAILDADVVAGLLGRGAAAGADAIAKAAAVIEAAGPGGAHLASPETRARARSRAPSLVPDEWLYESWLAAGAPDSTERAQRVLADLGRRGGAGREHEGARAGRRRELAAAIAADLVAVPPAAGRDEGLGGRGLADLASSFYSAAMREAFGLKG